MGVVKCQDCGEYDFEPHSGCLARQLAARDARIAELERERDALKYRVGELRRALFGYSGSQELHFCFACTGTSSEGPREIEHDAECPLCPRDNGSSAKEDADG